MKHTELYSNNFTNILFGGRLAEYKYYDMYQVIKSSLDLVKKRDIECKIVLNNLNNIR